MTMIYLANDRDDVQKGDPKVGGHPSASSSALHLLTVLHLLVKNPQDYIACKPHASPTDHASNYLMRLFREPDGRRMDDSRARLAMKNLRHFSHKGEPVFQSYHSAFDPDHFGYLPSGSVGIPPVNAVYLAQAYRMAKAQGHLVPSDAQFWCIMGDSEYREGSLMEVLPEVAERGLGNVTWIVDHNRQSLDGHRILNESGVGVKDCDRIEGTARSSGWEVIQLRHGSFRESVFKSGDASVEALKVVLEQKISDYEFNSLAAKKDAKAIVAALKNLDSAAAKAASAMSESDLLRFWTDLGGHDNAILSRAYLASKQNQDKPTLIVAHTIKGWNLRCASQSGNHSAMLEESEVWELRQKASLADKDLFAFERFADSSAESAYLKARGDWLWAGQQAQFELKAQNLNRAYELLSQTRATDGFPKELGINLKLVPMAHTQWMLGQLSAKLARLAETSLEDAKVQAPAKPLSAEEKKFRVAAASVVTMAPDVGTSTNLNASMDGRVWGAETQDFETELGIKDTKLPDIVPHQSATSRHIRFDIAEANAMSCAGSFGKLGDYLGIPFLPVMTVYDFFIKRALDQLFYNLYWQSSFVCVGTPSGVTLSPEGAQHAWKSDIQIANGITWEPAYAIELDWILTDTMKKHLGGLLGQRVNFGTNQGRQGVVIRGVTRALEQKELLRRLKTQARFAGLSDEQIMDQTRQDCLAGGYWLVDHKGQKNYNPGENVVQILAMGALVTEALAASDELLKRGVHANVLVVTSPDLLLGNLAEATGYAHLRTRLGVTGDLHLRIQPSQKSENGRAYPPSTFGPQPSDRYSTVAQLVTLGGRRIPIVSVHDGETGLLDNAGSIVGTLQKSLAVKKHSKSGRPSDIYAYHHLDASSVVEAAEQLLEESAFTPIQLDSSALNLASQIQGSLTS